MPSAEAELLRGLIERCGGPAPPSAVAVREGLEQGSGRLRVLEAELCCVRGSTATSETERSHRLQLLREHLRTLQEALDELRRRTGSPASSPLAHGFVLPDAPSGS